MNTTLTAKGRCCKDKPRCKRCPVVCKRLEQAGFLGRAGKRSWTVEEKVTKRALRAARG